MAHRTLLDRIVPAQRFFVARVATCYKKRAVLRAGKARMPRGGAKGTEFLGTGRTVDRYTLHKHSLLLCSRKGTESKEMQRDMRV